MSLPSMGPVKTPLLSAAFASALLLACSGGDTVAPAASAGELLMGELTGGEFLLESSEGYTPVAETTIRVSFGEGSFGFSGGCNSHGGDYSVEDGATLILNDLMSTEMGCDAERHEQDTWLANFFMASPTMALEGDWLTISGTEATLVFLDRKVADPDRALVGTLWTIDTIFDGGAARGGPQLDPAPTVTFSNDGSLSAQGSCARVNADYSVDGNEITLTNVSNAEGNCSLPTDDELDAALRNVFAAGNVTYKVDAARLTIERGSRGIGAQAE